MATRTMTSALACADLLRRGIELRRTINRSRERLYAPAMAEQRADRNAILSAEAELSGIMAALESLGYAASVFGGAR